MTVPAPSVRQRFIQEVRRTEGDLDLARAALLVAAEQYPHLPVEGYLARLDLLAEEVHGRLGGETAPPIILQELLDTVYRRNGFRGNREAYYDPRNSFLNDVLDRRLGIPLTLGILLLEVGWRLGLPVEGVSFPHHFLVRYRGEEVELLIDPFDGGAVRFEDQAQELLDRVYGGMVRVQPGFLKTATRRDMLVRLLNNLKGVYVNAQDGERAIGVVERILVLRPDAQAERRALGLLLARVGRRAEARTALETYLGSRPAEDDATRIREILERLEVEGADGAYPGDLSGSDSGIELEGTDPPWPEGPDFPGEATP